MSLKNNDTQNKQYSTISNIANKNVNTNSLFTK